MRASQRLALLFILYVVISVTYFALMDAHAPLGMEWRPWHSNFVRSAAENLSLHPKLAFAGITFSGLDFSNAPFESSLLDGRYIVPSYQFIIHWIFLKFFSASIFSYIGFSFDFVLTCSTAALCSILGSSLIISDCSKSSRVRDPIFFFSATSIFSLFLSSVWTYRSLLAPWQELSFCFSSC